MTENWLLTEILAQERMHAAERIRPHVVEALELEMEERDHRGVRATMASALVRLGMTLDDAAGRRAAALPR
jgi:hypothetical protein